MTMFMFFVDLKRVQSLRDVDVNTQRNEGLGGPTNLDGAGPTQRSVFHQGSKKMRLEGGRMFHTFPRISTKNCSQAGDIQIGDLFGAFFWFSGIC